MSDTIIYHPHQSHGRFVPFTIGVEIFSFVAGGYCLPRIDLFCFCFFGIGIPCLVLSKILYDSSNNAVLLEQDGLRIVEGRSRTFRYILWKEVPYVYFTRSYKGHSFVVLSPKVLNRKQAQAFTNRGANTSRISVDFVVVIHINAAQSASLLKEAISSSAQSIDEYL